MATATIFRADQAAWGRKAGAAYGVRFESQYLPREVWVVGFLAVNDDGEIQELLAPGYISPGTEASWEASVEFARRVLRGEWVQPYEGLVA